jgi:RNA polymerase sigma-70 factor
VAEPDLSTLVERCLATGREKWPDVACADARLRPIVCNRLAAHAPDDAHLADVFIAAAACAGDPAAIEWIHRRVAELAPAAVRGIVPPAERDEVVQRVAVKLVVDDADASGRIASYGARGSLDAWLRAVIVRTALTMRRRLARAAEVTIDESAWLELPFLAESPELAATWRRHAPAFRAAFELAVADLAPRARVVLRQHYVDGLSADELGRIYRAHRVTVYRWIVEARAAVLDRVRRELGARIAASPSEIDSLIRGLRSGFSITLERVFPKAGRAAATAVRAPRTSGKRVY